MALLESDPQDLLLDADGDLVIDEQGVHFVSGLQAVAQAIRFRILLVRGEWFLNMDIGVPYFDDVGVDGILGDNYDEAAARAAIVAAILDAPGVTGILSLTLERDPATRTLYVSGVAQSLFGDTPIDRLGV